MSFNPEKFTIKSREAVQGAQSLAESKGHRQLVALHLLQALVAESDGVPRAVLQKIGVNFPQLTKMIDSEIGRLPSSSGSNVPLQGSPEIMQVFDAAQKLTTQMQDSFVSTEHLFLHWLRSTARRRSCSP